MNSMIMQSTKRNQKILETDLTTGLKQERHPGSWRPESTLPVCVQLLCFSYCTKPDTSEGLRWDHTKLEILKKFPKLKASISSCDSKLIFFLF